MTIEKCTILRHLDGYQYECTDIVTALLPIGHKTYHFVPAGRPPAGLMLQSPVVVTRETIKSVFIIKEIDA